MKDYRIEYKKVIVAYRKWFVPVYDFRFCIVETETTYVAYLPTYYDTLSGYPDYDDMRHKIVTETLIDKFYDESEANAKLALLKRYNTV